ncbi:hypothetical protein NL676_027771 [Syzygium grande]|nr:hypothetical protein NL676_027771 [Syzygium grande]
MDPSSPPLTSRLGSPQPPPCFQGGFDPWSFRAQSLAFDPCSGGLCTGVVDGRVLKWENDERGWSTSLSLPLRVVLLFIVDKSAGISLVIERGDTATSSDRDNARPMSSLVTSLKNKKTTSLWPKTNGFAAIVFSLRDGEDKHKLETKQKIERDEDHSLSC